MNDFMVAHLGGFAMGLFAVTLFVPLTPPTSKAAARNNPTKRRSRGKKK